MSREILNNMKSNHIVTATFLLLATTSLWAQTDPHAGHDMGQHNTSTGNISTDDASTDDAPVNKNPPAEDHSAHSVNSSATIDHSNMPMEEESNARDPHAYSDGFSRHNAPYAVAGVSHLHLTDEHYFGSLLVDRLERVAADDNFTAYDAKAWFGRTDQKLVLKAEGEYAHGKLEETNTELLYSHAVASFWDVQTGVRYDTGDGPDRSWLALGVQGLAPYWFELDTTVYLGESGRTALSIQAEYELFLTQRIILQPRAEINAYSKNDPETGTGSGLADAAVGLRIRYEFSRQFAPYLGVEWTSKFGNTADYVEAEGGSSHDTLYVAGVRFWY